MRKVYALIVAMGLGISGFSQDFHLSQYDAAALNLNPAMTGMFKGNIRVHGHYRTQWSAVATKPFTTGILAADMPVGKFAIGLQVANFRAGAGNYNVAQALFSVARDFKLDKNNNHHLSFGLQGGAFQKSVDFSRLAFEAQYTSASGGSFDQSLSNGESFAGNSIIQPDVNAGLVYYYAKEGVLLNPFIGGSVFHLNQPTESFIKDDNKLPIRWIGHAGVKVNVTERFQVLPKVFYMGEKNARELTYAADFHYFMKDSDAYLIFGATYRSEDAAIATGGLKMGRFIYRVSYDINTSTLQPVSNGRGGLELSITFINQKINPNPVKTCPRI